MLYLWIRTHTHTTRLKLDEALGTSRWYRNVTDAIAEFNPNWHSLMWQACCVNSCADELRYLFVLGGTHMHTHTQVCMVAVMHMHTHTHTHTHMHSVADEADGEHQT